MTIWLLQAFNGLSLGSILLMISLGLAFSFGLMNVINMAHGEFIMAGAYVTYLFQHNFAAILGGTDLGLWFILAIPAAFLITAGLGILLEVGLIRFLYGRPLDTLLATWGVGLIFQQTARSIFGASNVQVSSPVWLSGAMVVAPGLMLPYKRLFIIGLVLLCIGGIYVLLYRTSNGRRIRAAMQNRAIASTLGVATRRVDALTFGLGAGLAGVAGCALTLIGPIGPALGTYYIVDAFMVVVLGGVGQLPGTIAAALLIGIFNTLFELGTTATLGKVLVFLLIIAFLQWKPAGLAALRTR
ncbi:MAG: urea ABC transporter permease subunit UrtB [Chloroflexales bacterium]